MTEPVPALHGWLGTRPLLADPTYIGYIGYLRLPASAWVPGFAAYMPVGALSTLAIELGVAQVLSRLWSGQGAFEQMVNVLTFATVPGLAIGWLSEWLTGMPLALLTGEQYVYAAAMRGAFGPTVAALWTAYSIDIRRVQRIPWWGQRSRCSSASPFPC